MILDFEVLLGQASDISNLLGGICNIQLSLLDQRAGRSLRSEVQEQDRPTSCSVYGIWPRYQPRSTPPTSRIVLRAQPPFGTRFIGRHEKHQTVNLFRIMSWDQTPLPFIHWILTPEVDLCRHSALSPEQGSYNLSECCAAGATFEGAPAVKTQRFLGLTRSSYYFELDSAMEKPENW